MLCRETTTNSTSRHTENVLQYYMRLHSFKLVTHAPRGTRRLFLLQYGARLSPPPPHCSADHERDWPPCKVVFFGLATNALNVRKNSIKCIASVSDLFWQVNPLVSMFTTFGEE